MKHKLMIKQHNKTGLKYLCYTTKEGDAFTKYCGSGKYWKRHLKEHGNDITTDVLLETEDYTEFTSVALQKSIEWDIINSVEWANLKYETGDGGDTVSNKRWITNGIEDKYWSKEALLPDGWYMGRSNCVFNDSEKQKVFSLKRDNTKFSESLKAAWDEGKFDKRDHSKCGVRGDQNPAKRKEVRDKIKEAASNRSEDYYKLSGQKSGAARLGKKRGPYRKKTV